MQLLSHGLFHKEWTLLLMFSISLQFPYVFSMCRHYCSILYFCTIVVCSQYNCGVCVYVYFPFKRSVEKFTLEQKNFMYTKVGWKVMNGTYDIYDMALFTRVQHLFNSNIVAPLFITFCQMFERHRTPSACKFLLMFSIDRPIARISSSLLLYSRWLISDYRVNMVDVPESPIPSDAEVRESSGVTPCIVMKNYWVLYYHHHHHQCSSLQAQESSLQFCRWQVFHHKLRNQDCSFTRGWKGAVASRTPLSLSLAAEQTLKDLKRSQGHDHTPRGVFWKCEISKLSGLVTTSSMLN